MEQLDLGLNASKEVIASRMFRNADTSVKKAEN